MRFTFEASDAPGVLRGLTLGVVEVGGHRDDRLLDLFAEVVLGGLPHLLKNLGGNLRRRHFLTVDLDPSIAVVRLDDVVGNHVLVFADHMIVVTASNKALYGEQGILRIGNRLALC